jgi:hypothetical protein
MNKNRLTIDPGKNGALCIKAVEELYTHKPLILDFKKCPTHFVEAMDYLDDLVGSFNTGFEAILENAKPQPHNSKKTWRSNGENLMMWQCALYHAGIPCRLISPQKWQKALDPKLPKEYDAKKKHIRAMMKQFYTDKDVFMWNADALAIMHVWDKIYDV